MKYTNTTKIVLAAIVLFSTGASLALITGTIGIPFAEACCTIPPIVIPPPPPPSPIPPAPLLIPVCTLSASPSVIGDGQQTRLSWTSQNAVYGTWFLGNSAAGIFGFPGDPVGPNGSDSLKAIAHVSSSTAYTNPALVMYSATGAATICSTEVDVTPNAQPVSTSTPPGFIVSFMASPSQVVLGGSSDLSWNTNHASSCQIQTIVGGSVVKTVTDVGTNSGDPMTVTPRNTATYRLGCTLQNGTFATQDAVVTVSTTTANR